MKKESFMKKVRLVMRFLRVQWWKLKVFFGFGVWAKRVLCYPKYQRCAFHGCRIKRGRKTEVAAFYYCPKCRRGYWLEGGGTKLVPA